MESPLALTLKAVSRIIKPAEEKGTHKNITKIYGRYSVTKIYKKRLKSIQVSLCLTGFVE
jgi:hypothetical protein